MKTRKITLALFAAAALTLGIASAKHHNVASGSVVGPTPTCRPNSPDCPWNSGQ